MFDCAHAGAGLHVSLIACPCIGSRYERGVCVRQFHMSNQSAKPPRPGIRSEPMETVVVFLLSFYDRPCGPSPVGCLRRGPGGHRHRRTLVLPLVMSGLLSSFSLFRGNTKSTYTESIPMHSRNMMQPPALPFLPLALLSFPRGHTRPVDVSPTLPFGLSPLSPLCVISQSNVYISPSSL